jgi:hypothetical protein
MCNCKKKPEVLQPIPQTPDELHTQEMNNYAKGLSTQIDVIVTERPTTEDELKQIEDFENKTQNNG